MSDPIDKVSAALTFAQLNKLRDEAGNNRVAQNALGPMEHQAFAREWVRDSPVLATASLPFAIPAYTASKALGLQKSRSDASWAEIKAGYAGLMQGLFQ